MREKGRNSGKISNKISYFRVAEWVFPVYLQQQRNLEERVRSVLKSKYDLDITNLVLEQPPEIRFGEYALPVAFELAKRLKKAPRKIAEELVAELAPLEGFASFEVAGAGYINAKLDRVAALQAVARDESGTASSGLHVLVEHTSINPNKAAHIGHLRNAILGDTFVRLLRANGQKVDVQNYIDNTGVQVADVVVGLQHLETLSYSEVRGLLAVLRDRGERVDFYCWDLYARVSAWYDQGSDEEKKAKKKIRLDTLHQLEEGGNETSEIAEILSTAVLYRHLETMLRLDIEYDLLPRESDILHLNFWAFAFEQLKAKGVLYFETEGKNKGCWVMTRASHAGVELRVPVAENGDNEEEGTAPDEDAKVIVRSNGTVTYVGKDIAYHLWKFGLLGKDFGYRPFFQYSDRECWISDEVGVPEHPHFGGAQAIYNVIDSRQSDPQSNVIEALRGLGYTAEADRYTHFSYDMVVLTPRCALELGYELSEADLSKPFIGVSGRKGFGVKADDLLDKLIEATQREVDSRQPDRDLDERERIANEIAVGALRYFMLKYTRNSIIAFDFKDALSFEGETGPYVQYAVVRSRNIFRKAGTTAEAVLEAFSADGAEVYLGEEGAEDIWSLWLRASKTALLLEQCIQTAEPAYLAKHAFQMAQDFNNFYHRHHILTEEDAGKKQLLLATAAVAQRELIRALGWLGIKAPEAM